MTPFEAFIMQLNKRIDEYQNPGPVVVALIDVRNAAQAALSEERAAIMADSLKS